MKRKSLFFILCAIFCVTSCKVLKNKQPVTEQEKQEVKKDVEAAEKKEAVAIVPPVKELTLPREEVKEVEKIQIAGGTYTMGSKATYVIDEEEHQEKVSDFKMSKTEITNGQYCLFLNAAKVNSTGKYNENLLFDVTSKHIQISFEGNVWQSKSGYENYPMICVTWYGADEYCKYYGGRLPTEAEWEYAARGGNKKNTYSYAGSNFLDMVAWFAENSGNDTRKVATKNPNALGLHDMSGNVEEWCFDWYNRDYNRKKQDANAQKPTNKVVRGGSFASSASACRVSDRNYNLPANSNFNTGFRIVFYLSFRALSEKSVNVCRVFFCLLHEISPVGRNDRLFHFL